MEAPSGQVGHADHAGKARQTWRAALKLRKLLTKQFEKLPKDNNSSVDISQFEAIDGVLDKFRLSCVQTIFLDYEYAVAERADHALWAVHTSINHEYRRILGRLRYQAQNADKQKSDKSNTDKRNGDKQKTDKQNAQKQKGDKRNVEKRKLGEKYMAFLNIAQEFYKGYIQRLSARYDISELKRIAQGIEVQETSSTDIISPVPKHIYQMVLNSCHFTLICLGDLARYQVQSGLKKSSYRVALAYYSLAHDLKSDSGFPFHQMGIISLEEAKDLDVIYYFYRSIVVTDPHPNAKQNLESKFKTIMQPDKAPSRKQARSQPDAFITWFAKLHASYYRDEVMSQSSELEREVLHRLDMASKSSTHTEALFKMSLINMSSYYVASSTYAESQSPTASRFCQHTLRLNSQFILSFSNALSTGLTAVVNRERSEPEDPATAKTSTLIESLLPLLRIYLVWLVAHRGELFGAAEALGSVLPDMAQALVKVFNLLCSDTYTNETFSACPYLFQEDIEIQGLLSFSNDKVPPACRFSYQLDGTLKPRRPSEKNQLTPFQETLARILDILRCAYFLAEDPAVPLTQGVIDHHLVFEYQKNFKPQPAMVANVIANSQPAPVAPHATSNEVNVISQVASQQQQASAPSECSLPSRSAARDKAKKAASMASLAQARHQAPSPDHAENTVINMLAPFLRPPTPEQQNMRSPDETSYGMHSATANEVFGLLHSESSPTGSLPPGKFEPLPWNWVYTPTPHSNDASASATKDAFDAPISPRFAARDVPQTNNALEDPFSSPRRHLSASFAPRSASSMMGSPGMVSASEEAHRNQLLQSFASASTSAPRVSTFSQWGQNTSRVPKETAPPSYGHQVFNGYPMSSAASAFSHPSSLYQGTPVNGAVFGMPEDGFAVPSRFVRGQSQDSAARPSSSRHFQMDETASSYDAAIFHAALHNK